MKPGEKETVTLVLLNGGPDAKFTLTVQTTVTGSDLFDYTITPYAALLKENSSIEIDIEINLSNNITDGTAITFTVVAESALGDSNSITFNVVVTTRPPPEFTENVRHAGFLSGTTVTLSESVEGGRGEEGKEGKRRESGGGEGQSS